MRFVPRFVITILVGCSASAAFVPAGCSASDSAGKSPGTGGGGGSGGSGGIEGGVGCGACISNHFTQCDAAGNKTDVDCGTQLCVPSLGCLDCAPGVGSCVGNDVHTCSSEGKPGEFVKSCDVSAGELCKDGVCKSECEIVAGAPSNVGCEFWAVDLPNERGLNDAAAQPWGVVLSNAGVTTAQVTIQRNNAAPGQPLDLETVHTTQIAPDQLETVGLPRAEVTGWTETTLDPPGPPGSFLSSKAFRITSTAPLVVYQFNNFTNNYSNDASLLMPRNGLGSLYRVLGHPTANPIAIDIPGLPIPAGIPDRTSVTIVGVTAGTSVTVIAGTAIVADGNGIIPPTPKGGEIKMMLGPFDVLNLSSDGIPGDLTGTIVESSQPVAVFSSGERIIGPYLDPAPPPPPGYESNQLCCTDHFEEQLFPVTSLGKQFVISRSPVRSTGGYAEPDVLRFLGVAALAQVKTNLPAPFDDFSLQPGELKETWTDKDIVVDSSEPITIGQFLVSAGFTTSYIGDPALTIFPPVEQYRNEYQFLIPPSWSSNHFVIAARKGGSYVLDGSPLPASCITAPAGTLAGSDYEAIRCPVTEGAHRVKGAEPFGLTVYGWGNVGSYAFAGGADVKPIYDPPPIPH
jgi:hypothetical protein